MADSGAVYLLDTNACINLIRLAPKPVAILRAKSPDRIRICSVVRAELTFGACNSQHVEHNLAVLRRFLAPYESLSFDDAAADQYGPIRSHLKRQGIPIGANDLMIAAIARAHDVTLVTHNTGEFSRVPGLRLEDWEA